MKIDRLSRNRSIPTTASTTRLMTCCNGHGEDSVPHDSWRQSVRVIQQRDRGEDREVFAELAMQRRAPRRSAASSIDGRSSRMSEQVWIISIACRCLDELFALHQPLRLPTAVSIRARAAGRSERFAQGLDERLRRTGPCRGERADSRRSRSA